MATSSNEPETPGEPERQPPGNETMAAPGYAGGPGGETRAAPAPGNETMAAPGSWTPPPSATGPGTGPGAGAGQPTGWPPQQPPTQHVPPASAWGQPGQPHPGQPTGGYAHTYGGATPPPGGIGTGPGQTPGGGSRGSRTLLLAGIVAGVAVLAVVLVSVLMLRGDDPTEPGTAASEPGTVAEPTTTTTESRVGETVRGVGLKTGDCIDYDTTSASIATFDLVACDGPHLAEVTGLIEHPQAAQAFPGTDELFRFADDCGPVSDDYLGIDSYQTELLAYVLIPDETDWGEGMYRVACLAGTLSGEPLAASVSGAGADHPRGDQVPVVRLAIGDCFGPVDPEAEILSVSIDDTVSLLPCDQHHPGFFFGRSVLHDFPPEAPWPGDEAVDLASDTVCDVQFSRWFGIGTDAGFKYRFWRPTADTWANGERSVYCMVADDRGLPPDLNFADWVPVSLQPVGTCFIFPPDTEYETLDSNLHVNDVPCEAYHHGEIFGSGQLPAGPFPADVVTDTNVACESHFIDYVGVESANSYFKAYVFWTPLAETWEDPGGRDYACSLLAVLPIQGSARGANR